MLLQLHHTVIGSTSQPIPMQRFMLLQHDVSILPLPGSN